MLNQALATNALFSAGSALFILQFQENLQRFLPAPGWLWILLAAGLLIFSADLLFLSRKPALARRFTPLVVAADGLWIAATLAVCVVFRDVISSPGWVLVLAVNIVVGTLAAWQFQEYRMEQPGMRAGNASPL